MLSDTRERTEEYDLPQCYLQNEDSLGALGYAPQISLD